MKTIIAGSRGICNFAMLEKAIAMSGFQPDITEVVSGGAPGVDKMAIAWAKKEKIPWKVMRPDYIRFQKKYAPLERNGRMAEYADALIAVWDGESTGTADMISKAKFKKLKFYIFEV